MCKPILETERLMLREIIHDDLDGLLEIWGDAEAMRFFPDTLTAEGMSAWIERNLKRYERDGHGLWAVILRSERKLIGDCGLVVQEIDGVEEIEVGYHFNKNFWGRGLATEAALACLDYAFNQLKCPRVISLIRPENILSRRVAERNGLRIEKEISRADLHHYIYALDRDAFNSRPR